MSALTDLNTLLGRHLQTSVKVHHIFIPANSLRRNLHKFGNNLVSLTGCETFQFQLIGSTAGISYRDRKFFVCTAHQIKQINEVEKVGIILLDENCYISSSGYSYFKGPNSPRQSDAEDLLAFEFTQQAAERATLARRFFPLSLNTILNNDDNVVGYLAYGCPFNDQKYDVFDENRLGMVIRSITCDPEIPPSDLSLGVCRALSPMDFNPNGLSGGPVFAVVLYGSELIVKFAGVINRSGNGLVYFIKAANIKHLIDLSFNS